jgi:hypothetical protein
MNSKQTCNKNLNTIYTTGIRTQTHELQPNNYNHYTLLHAKQNLLILN